MTANAPVEASPKASTRPNGQAENRADIDPDQTPAPYASTTTLAAIRDASPCENGWKKLLAHLGKSKADNEPLPLLTVLESNGLDDALWVTSYAMPDNRLARHFQAWCADQVLHLFETERPGDTRVRDQIAMLRRDDASDDERTAARAASLAAARPAARVASGSRAWKAAQAASGAAAWTSVQDASLDASLDASVAASLAAAWNSAREAQERQLRSMIGGAE